MTDEEAVMRAQDFLKRMEMRHLDSTGATDGHVSQTNDTRRAAATGWTPLQAVEPDRPPAEPPPPPEPPPTHQESRMHNPPSATAPGMVMSGQEGRMWLETHMHLLGRSRRRSVPGRRLKRYRRRMWRNRGLLGRKRRIALKRRKRKKKGVEKPKRDNTNTVWLKGQPGEPRLSLQYRVKLEGAHTHVTLGATLAFVNVRTLRQNRKVNHSGSLSHGRTKNNWKVPMLVHLMKQKGIYLMAGQRRHYS